MDEKLTLNDGTELTGHMVETDSRLFLYLYGITLTEAFELLNDPRDAAVFMQRALREPCVIVDAVLRKIVL